MQTPIIGPDATRIHFGNVSEEQYAELVAPHVSGRKGGQQYFYGKRYFGSPRKHNAFSVQSSVLKFADPGHDGFGLADGEDVKRGIKAFEKQTGLGAGHASVTMIEMSAMFEATLSPESYYELIRPKNNFKICQYPNGCYLRSKESQIIIYNKRRELEDKYKIVYDPSAPQIMKVEVRLNRKLRQKIAPWLPVLEFESLTDPNVLHSLGCIFESYVTRLLDLDDFAPSMKGRLTITDYLALAAEEMRLRRAHEHEEVLSEILDKYGADQKTRERISTKLEKERLYYCGSEVRHHIQQLCHEWKEKYPFHIDADPAIRENMDALREFSKSRQTSKAERQDKRTAQAILKSQVL